MIKNYNLRDDRIELKIIPFKYERKINNEIYIYIGHTVMKMIIQ